jgi:hypothetical protein
VSERERDRFVRRDGVRVVERDLVCRWMTLIDLDGAEHRWMVKSGHEGMRLYASLRGAPVSPVFWSPLSMVHWLRTSGLRPKGSRAEVWQPLIAEQRMRRELRAA